MELITNIFKMYQKLPRESAFCCDASSVATRENVGG